MTIIMQTHDKTQRKWYGNPFIWFGTGIACFLLYPFLLMAVTMLNWAYRDIPRHGEHLPKAEEYSPHATNYSYYNRLLHQVCEFDIPENVFLEMCRTKKWQPVAIETLPELPIDKTQDEERFWVNSERRVPLEMMRYVWHKPEHENCGSHYGDCKVDLGGKMDASCFRSVSQGYYYEIRGSNGGGIKILYDSENGRCYIHSNPW